MTLSRREFLAVAGAGVAVGFAGRPTTARASPPVARRVEDTPRTPIFVSRDLPARIIGVGGAGVGIVSQELHGRATHAESVLVDRDEQALRRATADVKLQIGRRKPRGLDHGGRPAYGREAIEECREDVLAIVRDTHLAIVVAGLGGGTGTGAAPAIARLARDAGALTLAVVTRPFAFEGRRRNAQAAAGIRELDGACDAMIVVPNDAVLDFVGRHAPYRHVMARADAAVATVVDMIARIDAPPEGELVCVGLPDIRAVLKGCGPGAVGIGKASGLNRARVAAARALASPLLRDVDPGRAGGVIVQVAAADPTIDEIREAMDLVYDATRDDCIFFADARVPALGDALRVTLIAEGPAAARR